MSRLEKHAWWLLVATAALSVVFGLGDIVTGQPDDALSVTGLSQADLAGRSPQAYRLIEESVRTGGIQLVAISVAWLAILLAGFRRNAAWAWWTMWSLPLMLAALATVHFATVAAGESPAVPAYSGSIVAVLDALVMIVSAPRFFGRSASLTVPSAAG